MQALPLDLIVREFSLLSRVYRHNAALGPRVSVPPGDDMGMVSLAKGRDVLAAVDQVVDGKHFRLATTPLELIGRKAVARSLSDIAAMAAEPVAALAAVVLPRSFEESQALALFEGMRVTAEKYRCPLIGGDISIADMPLTCSVTVLAEPGPRGAVTRGGARAGDAVYVTGTLGGAYDERTGGGKHLTFEPRIELALELARLVELHAMLDVSDGLGRDAEHIAEMSGVSISLDAALLPLTPGCDWRRAMGDGEDYELCFTAAADARVPRELLGVPITRVGRVEEIARDAGEPRVTLRVDGATIGAATLGWEHRG